MKKICIVHIDYYLSCICQLFFNLFKILIAIYMQRFFMVKPCPKEMKCDVEVCFMLIFEIATFISTILNTSLPDPVTCMPSIALYCDACMQKFIAGSNWKIYDLQIS